MISNEFLAKNIRLLNIIPQPVIKLSLEKLILCCTIHIPLFVYKVNNKSRDHY